MSEYTLSCCSTADVSVEWLAQHRIKCIYFSFCLNNAWYDDDFGKTIPPRELYQRMLAGEEASTSQIATGDYIEFFRNELAQGNDVVHVTLSSGISNTYNSAVLAANQVRSEFPDRTIRIVDSRAATSAIAMLMDKLATLRDQGMSANELADWAEAHRLEVNHLFLSADLTFFIRGGRISKAAGYMGGLLKICPLMRVAPDGSLEVMEKIRTKKKSQQRMVQRMHELAQNGDAYDGSVYISHSDCMEDALEVAHAIAREFPNIANGKVEIFPIGATIGCHTGPGTTALFFWGNPNRW